MATGAEVKTSKRGARATKPLPSREDLALMAVATAALTAFMRGAEQPAECAGWTVEQWTRAEALIEAHAGL